VSAGIVGGEASEGRWASWVVADWNRGCHSWDEASDRATVQARARIRSESSLADTRG
jgi:hypothetical protein